MEQCLTTLPDKHGGVPHECRFDAGHEGWHTCKHCGCRWTHSEPQDYGIREQPTEVSK